MSILVNVINQKMYVSSNADGLVAGSQQFVKFKFNMSEEWDGLMVFAQFRQGTGAYNRYLDKDNCVYLPAEIGVGTCTMMLYGTHDTTIGTTNYLTFKIGKNNLVSDASSTDISQSLYDQLVTKVNALTSWNKQSVADIEDKVNKLELKLNALDCNEGGGALSAKIIDNVLVVALAGGLTANIKDGVLVVS